MWRDDLDVSARWVHPVRQRLAEQIEFFQPWVEARLRTRDELGNDERGHGTVIEPRLYQLVRQRGEIAERTLEIEFSAAGVEAYVFTFG